MGIEFPDKYPETLQLIVLSLHGYLTSVLKMDHIKAASAAFDAAEAVRKTVGGGPTYIPKGVSYEADLRAAEIYAGYNGRNLIELARKYDLTPERVRQICNERHELETKRRQGRMDF